MGAGFSRLISGAQPVTPCWPRLAGAARRKSASARRPFAVASSHSQFVRHLSRGLKRQKSLVTTKTQPVYRVEPAMRRPQQCYSCYADPPIPARFVPAIPHKSRFMKEFRGIERRRHGRYTATVAGVLDYPDRPTIRFRYAVGGDHQVKARRGAKVLTEVDRDRKAYALARAYLLDHGAQGITAELLQHYVSPRPRGSTPRTMGEVFHRLLLSARNRNMMASVIPDSFVCSATDFLDSRVSVFTPPA